MIRSLANPSFMTKPCILLHEISLIDLKSIKSKLMYEETRIEFVSKKGSEVTRKIMSTLMS